MNRGIRRLVQGLSSPGFVLAIALLGQVVAALRFLSAIAWTLSPRRPKISRLSFAILVGSLILRSARLYEASRIARRSEPYEDQWHEGSRLGFLSHHVGRRRGATTLVAFQYGFGRAGAVVEKAQQTRAQR